MLSNAHPNYCLEVGRESSTLAFCRWGKWSTGDRFHTHTKQWQNKGLSKIVPKTQHFFYKTTFVLLRRIKRRANRCIYEENERSLTWTYFYRTTFSTALISVSHCFGFVFISLKAVFSIALIDLKSSRKTPCRALLPGTHTPLSEKSSVKHIVPTENPHETVTCSLEKHQVLWKDNVHAFIQGEKSAILLRSTSTHRLTWAGKKKIHKYT